MMHVTSDESEEHLKHTMERLCRNRAPWFKDVVKNIDWAARVRFEHRLAKQFGSDRGWLAGDAAHQTSPVGGQSMNEGLLEAEALAAALKKILRDGGSHQLLDEYNHVHKTKWERLLNKNGELRVNNASNPWLKERAARILCCMPGCGEHSAEMMAQLGYEFESSEISSTPAR